MNVNVKNRALNFVNAAALPLLVIIMSQICFYKDPATLSAFDRLVAGHRFSFVSALVLFAIGYSLLRHIRWPFHILVYVAGGALSLYLYNTLFPGAQLTHVSVFGIYALLGTALISGLKRRFTFLFFPWALPGFVWLLLIIAILLGGTAFVSAIKTLRKK